MRPNYSLRLIVVILMMISCRGYSQTWDNDSTDYKWNTGANWSGNTVPSSGANVTFSSTGVGTINVDTTPTINTLTFDSGAGAYTFTNNNITINWAGPYSISNGSSSVQTFAKNVIAGGSEFHIQGTGETRYLGNANTGSDFRIWKGGNLNLDGGTLTTSYLRGWGDTTIKVINGGFFTNSNEVKLGWNGAASTNNNIIVSGTGSSWGTANILTVGEEAGWNTVIVSNGGAISTANQFRMGSGPNASNNTATITGTGSTLTVAQSLYVGSASSSNVMNILNGGSVIQTGSQDSAVGDNSSRNSLNITAGGYLTNTGTIYIGNGGSASSNIMTVSGAGSRWNTAGQIRLQGGTGNRLIISNGGVVNGYNANNYVGPSGTDDKIIITGAGSKLNLTGNLDANNAGGSGNETIIDQGGKLIVGDTLDMNGASKKVTLNGGTLEVNKINLNGQTLQVGDGTQKARFQVNNLSGSSFSGGYKANINSNAIFAIGGAQSVTLSSLVSSYITTNVGSGFGGTGFLTGDYTYGNGATVAPGNSPGTFTQTGAVTFASLGNYDWEINSFGGTAGTDPGWDLFNISGTLDISATSGSKFNINLLSLTTNNLSGLVYDFDGSTSYSNKIAQATSITGFSADKFNINAAGFSNSYVGSWTVGVSGNALYLYYTAVPEPSTYAMFAMGLLMSIYGLKISRARKQKA